MEIIQTEKRTSWRERLTSMEVGDYIRIDMQTCGTVSGTISKIKQMAPEMNWTVKKIRENGYGRHLYAHVTRLS